MDLLQNLFKSTILATLIFWLIIFSKTFEADMFLLLILSIIPVFSCCAIVISFTIYPFFRAFEKKSVPKEIGFNRIFPYYSTLNFGLCSYFIVSSNFENHVVAFFMASFITTSYSWMWFSKTNAS